MSVKKRPAKKQKAVVKKKPGVAVRCSYKEMREVTALVPHPRNPNQHPEKQIELLAKIVKHQGWRSPVVVSARSGFVVAGHARLSAAISLGEERVPVDVQEFANEADEWAHLVADNRIAELAETDYQVLGVLLKEMAEDMDKTLTGYDDHELENLLKAEWAPALVEAFDEHVLMGDPIKLTKEQRAVFDRAKEKATPDAGEEASDGRIVELICADFLAG